MGKLPSVGDLWLTRVTDPSIDCGFRLRVEHEDPLIQISAEFLHEVRENVRFAAELGVPYPVSLIGTPRGDCLRIEHEDGITVYVIKDHDPQTDTYLLEWPD